MARKKRPARLRPKTPARVRKRTRRKSSLRAHHHPELVGLGLLAFGLFMAAVLYAGWNGGYVGRAIGDGFVAVVGGTAYVLPAACIAIGGLMVAKSDLPRVAPFRTGLVVSALGLALVLGSGHGGYLGRGLEDVLGRPIGSTGTHILGVFLLLAGALLISGASAGAILRRSAHSVRSAARRPAERRRSRPEPAPVEAAPSRAPLSAPPPVDGMEAFPDVVAPSPLLTLAATEGEHEEEDESQTSLFDATEPAEESVYTLPDPGLLRRSKAAAANASDQSGRVSGVLVQALANFGVDATVVGEISGPRVTR